MSEGRPDTPQTLICYNTPICSSPKYAKWCANAKNATKCLCNCLSVVQLSELFTVLKLTLYKCSSRFQVQTQDFVVHTKNLQPWREDSKESCCGN